MKAVFLDRTVTESLDDYNSSRKLDYFLYDIMTIPSVANKDIEIRFDELSGLRHLVDGSNSNISTGRYRQLGVILKFMKKDKCTNKVIEEFDLEHNILCRLRLLGIFHYFL